MLTIAEALDRHARINPDGVAFTYLIDGERETASLSFLDLATRSRELAAVMRQRRPESERALILQAPGIDFVVSLCACFYAGIAAVPAPLPAARANSRSARRLNGLFQDAAPDMVLTHSESLSRVRWVTDRQAGMPDSAWLPVDLAPGKDSLPGSDVMAEVTPDTYALIQYTSGSTASPKGVVINHRSLSHDLAGIAEKFSLTTESVVVSWLPPFHDMGLIGGIIEGIWSGYHTILLDPKHFLQRPLRWLEAIDRYRADVSGGVNFAFDLCSQSARTSLPEGLDLSCWRLAFSGAEPVRASTITRFSETFSDYGFSGEAFYPCYGLAEATLMATGPEPGSKRPLLTRFDTQALREGRAVTAVGEDQQVTELVSCGNPCRDTVVAIRDSETGQACADGITGEIWLSGPILMQGYWNRRTRRADEEFRPLADQSADRCLATGDLGFLLEGELYVTGRSKDLIIIRGKNYAPGDIEEAAGTSHPSLLLDGVAAFGLDPGTGEELVVACEVRREDRHHADKSEILTAIRRNITECSGLSAHDIVLLKPGSLPRTTSGKIQHHACRDCYLNETWSVLVSQKATMTASWNQADHRSLVIRPGTPEARFQQLETYLGMTLEALTGVSRTFISRDTPLSETGLDSLKLIEFSLHIERDLERPVRTDWFDAETTIGELADLIQGECSAEAVSATGWHADGDGAMAPIPLSPRQHEVLHAGLTNPATFVEVVLLRTPVDVDQAALAEAIEWMTRHYDAFSLRFRHEDDRWVQQYGKAGDGIAFERVDAANIAPAGFAELRSKLMRQFRSEISLSEGPLAKVFLIDRGAGERGMMMIGFHHLVVDAVSLSIWVMQFESAYTSFRNNGSHDISVAALPYGRWLQALDDYYRTEDVSGQLKYWQDQCTPAPEKTTEGRAFERSDGEGKKSWRMAGTRELSRSRNLRLLQKFPTGGERSSVMASALAWAWKRLTGEEDLLVRLEGHGRLSFDQSDPFSSIGWFACRYPFRVTTRQPLTVDDIVDDTLARFRAVPAMGTGYDMLMQGRAGEAARSAIENLPKPLVALQYRGSIDDAFRSDVDFPVIGVIHDSMNWKELADLTNDPAILHMSSSLRRNVLQWSFVASEELDEDAVNLLFEGVDEFLSLLIPEPEAA